MANHSDYKFRLLLLYHDPLLYRFLDSNKILDKWLSSRLSSHCSSNVAEKIRENAKLRDDPYNVFQFFLSLVVMMASRDRLMCSAHACKCVFSLPGELSVSDVEDMCLLAEHFEVSTPLSFSMLSVKKDALCMRVDIQELVECFRQRNRRFFLIDCRSQEQYDAGHLPTAYHLDCNLLYDASELSGALCGLLRAQRYAVASDKRQHLLLIGSSEDKMADMMSAALINVNARYVSVLHGGYSAVHQHCLQTLVDHDPEYCPVCSRGTKEKTTQLLHTIGAGIKNFKEKLTGILSPGRHTSSHESCDSESDVTDYVTPPMFAIGEDDSEVESEDEMIETAKFTLLFVDCVVNGELGDIALTPTHLVFLRDVSGWLGYSRVVTRRKYSDIDRINFSKTRPKSVGFKYKFGHPMKDKIVMARSLDAVRLIQCVQQMSRQEQVS